MNEHSQTSILAAMVKKTGFFINLYGRWSKMKRYKDFMYERNIPGSPLLNNPLKPKVNPWMPENRFYTKTPLLYRDPFKKPV